MAKGGSTRSGLLWEVERLLTEVDELPQILLMENVPQVIADKNVADFALWIKFLDSLGYQSKYKILNAKDYGIPQNRERCFMVSWLGDYYYDFPKPIPLDIRLKDILDADVDEKYYLSDAQLMSLQNSTYRQTATSVVDLGGWTDEDNLCKRLQRSEVCKAVRTSGRGSIDRHTWDLIVTDANASASCVVGNGKPT